MNTNDLKMLTEAYDSVVNNATSTFVQIVVADGEHAETTRIINAASIQDAVQKIESHCKQQANVDAEMVHSFVDKGVGIVTMSTGGFSIIVPESKAKQAQSPGFISKVRAHFDLPTADVARRASY